MSDKGILTSLIKRKGSNASVVRTSASPASGRKGSYTKGDRESALRDRADSKERDELHLSGSNNDFKGFIKAEVAETLYRESISINRAGETPGSAVGFLQFSTASKEDEKRVQPQGSQGFLAFSNLDSEELKALTGHHSCNAAVMASPKAGKAKAKAKTSTTAAPMMPTVGSTVATKRSSRAAGHVGSMPREELITKAQKLLSEYNVKTQQEQKGKTIGFLGLCAPEDLVSQQKLQEDKKSLKNAQGFSQFFDKDIVEQYQWLASEKAQKNRVAALVLKQELQARLELKQELVNPHGGATGFQSFAKTNQACLKEEDNFRARVYLSVMASQEEFENKLNFLRNKFGNVVADHRSIQMAKSIKLPAKTPNQPGKQRRVTKASSMEHREILCNLRTFQEEQQKFPELTIDEKVRIQRTYSTPNLNILTIEKKKTRLKQKKTETQMVKKCNSAALTGNFDILRTNSKITPVEDAIKSLTSSRPALTAVDQSIFDACLYCPDYFIEPYNLLTQLVMRLGKTVSKYVPEYSHAEQIGRRPSTATHSSSVATSSDTNDDTDDLPEKEGTGTVLRTSSTLLSSSGNEPTPFNASPSMPFASMPDRRNSTALDSAHNRKKRAADNLRAFPGIKAQSSAEIGRKKKNQVSPIVGRTRAGSSMGDEPGLGSSSGSSSPSKLTGSSFIHISTKHSRRMLRIVKFLNKYGKLHGTEIHKNPPMYDLLYSRYLRLTQLPSPFRKWGQMLMHSLGTGQIDEAKMSLSFPINVPVLELTNFTAKQIALALDDLSYKLYCRVPWECLLHMRWKKCQEYLDFTELINKLNLFVCATILCSDTSSRVQSSIVKWIDVAKHMYKLQNFAMLEIIVSSLGSSAISRLGHNKSVPKAKMIVIAEMSHILSYEYNYRTYRTLLNNVTPPFVPWLGVWTKDLVYIEELHAQTRGQLVLGQMGMIVQIVSKVRAGQQAPQVHPPLDPQSAVLRDAFSVTLLKQVPTGLFGITPLEHFRMYKNPLILMDEENVWEVSHLLKPTRGATVTKAYGATKTMTPQMMMNLVAKAMARDEPSPCHTEVTETLTDTTERNSDDSTTLTSSMTDLPPMYDPFSAGGSESTDVPAYPLRVTDPTGSPGAGRKSARAHKQTSVPDQRRKVLTRSVEVETAEPPGPPAPAPAPDFDRRTLGKCANILAAHSSMWSHFEAELVAVRGLRSQMQSWYDQCNGTVFTGPLDQDYDLAALNETWHKYQRQLEAMERMLAELRVQLNG